MTLNNRILPSLILSFGFVLSSIILAWCIASFSQKNNFVNVKGLAEREVVADLVVWPMSIRLTGNDLKGMQHSMNEMIDRVKVFLRSKGFEDSEITLSVPEIRDNFAFSSPQTTSYRFFIKLGMVLRTNKVKQVLLAVNQTVELVGYGIVLSEEYGAKPIFLFTKLNEIKPEMIKEATLNARAAAEQFAMDSGVNVGNIQQATQGFFTVEDRDLGSPQFKNVRVVTNVNYYLSN